MISVRRFSPRSSLRLWSIFLGCSAAAWSALPDLAPSAESLLRNPRFQDAMQEALEQAAPADAPKKDASLKALLDAAKTGDAAAITQLGQAAQAGVPAGMFLYGLMTEAGLGVKKDLTAALRWYLAAEAKGSQPASLRAGLLYYAGEGAPRNEPEAVRRWQTAAQAGDHDAQVFLAYAAHARREYDTARRWLETAQPEQTPAAAALLGTLHLEGHGVPANAITAEQWFHRAADAGNLAGRIGLTRLLVFGAKDFPRRPADAIPTLEKAAAANEAWAITLLGRCRALGLGVEPDDARAVADYRRAVELGDPDAMAWFGYHLRTGRGVRKDLAEAVRLWQQAIAPEQRPNVPALQLMAQLYLEGDEGILPDPKRALELVTLANNTGDDDSANVLQVLNLGQNVRAFEPYLLDWQKTFAAMNSQLAAAQAKPRGPMKADQFADRATPAEVLDFYQTTRPGKGFDSITARRNAEQGDAQSQTSYGLSLLQPESTPEQRSEGEAWLAKAAAQNQPEAQAFLGARLIADPSQVDRVKRGLDLLNQAANQDEHGSQLILGIWHLSPGAPAGLADPATGIHWFEQCAARKNPHALCEVGLCYLDGRGVKQDDAKASEMLLSAAGLGSAKAQGYLGNIALKAGRTDEAVKWFKAAVEGGEIRACVPLAGCYAEGRGVPVDMAMAYRLLFIASYSGDNRAAMSLRIVGSQVSPEKRAAIEQQVLRGAKRPAAPVPPK